MLMVSFPAYGNDKSRELENLRLDFIKASLDEKQIVYEERSLFESQGGFGKSIHIFYPSKNDNPENIQEQFVLAVPLTTVQDTPEIVRFDIQAALNLAEQLQKSSPPLDVRIAFLGDEYSRLPGNVPDVRNIGLADLCSIYDTPENVILFYMNLPFAPDKLTIHHGSNGIITPLNVLEPLTDEFESLSIPYSLYVKYNELYKLNLIQSIITLEKIQSLYFPGLLIEGSQSELNPFSAELCGDALMEFISKIKVSSENYDSHYSFLNAFNKTIYFSEIFTVLVFLAIAMLALVAFLVYSLTHRYILVVQWRVFLKRSWIILLHFLILVASLIVSDQIYFLVRKIFSIPAWHTDYISIFIKIFIALCFYNLCVPIFYRFWIPRKDRFYGNSAVVLVVIGTMVAVFLDITFVPIFLWAFIFTLLGAVITNPWIVLICTIAVPLQISGALINVITTNSPALATMMTSNNLYITLFIACIALPLILMANRIILLFRHGRSDKDLKSRTIEQLSIIGITIVLLAGLGIFITITKPPAPFRQVITELRDSERVLQVDLVSTEYLDRRFLSISMNALGNPSKFNIIISNADQDIPLVIYDAPMPYERLGGDNTVTFRLGERPDNPFETEIVLPAELQCTVMIEALYAVWDSNIEPEKPGNTEDYTATYRLYLSVPE